MKRSWSTYFLLSGLVALLAVLGVLQYRWQTQISVSDRERLEKRVRDEADKFAEDFNREIQNAYFNFQTDSSVWTGGNWRAFVERYEFWKSRTKYPALISEITFVPAAGDDAPGVYNAETRLFEDVSWTEELRSLRARSLEIKTFRAFDDETLTLVLPIHNEERVSERVVLHRTSPDVMIKPEIPEAYAFLLIRLDRDVVLNRVLPELAAERFGGSEFDLAVSHLAQPAIFTTGPAFTEGDAKADLFDLSPGNFVFFANKDLIPRSSEQKAVVMDQRVESRTYSHVEANTNTAGGTVTIQMKTNDQPKARIFTAKTGQAPAAWTAAVRHRDGSIDASIANAKFRNLSIGFGILGLLGLAGGALIYSAQRVRRSAQRQVDFVSSVSHEFRTPLAVIYSAGENLADGVAAEDGQVTKYGELIKGEGRKLSAMVEQILEFAGADSGRRRYHFAPVEVGAVIDRALAECRPLLDEHGIKPVCEVAAALPMLNADADAVGRAVQNLIVNAVKYRNGSDWIRITAENGGGTVKITVEDRGIGIAKGDLKHVFEPFFRARSVVDAQIHGNGLGLSLVKEIAVAHGGHVEARSEPGRGSSFTIELPQNS